MKFCKIGDVLWLNQQDEKLFQVSCQHVEPVDKTKACHDERTCKGCKQTLPILQFPPKGGGRREYRCGECHNQWRRTKYGVTHKPLAYAEGEMGFTLLDENHPGLNTILDLICDDIIKKEIAV